MFSPNAPSFVYIFTLGYSENGGKYFAFAKRISVDFDDIQIATAIKISTAKLSYFYENRMTFFFSTIFK